MGAILLNGTSDFLYHAASPFTNGPITVLNWFRASNATFRFGAKWWLGEATDIQHNRRLEYDAGGFNKRVFSQEQGTGNSGDPTNAQSQNAEGTAVAWHMGVGKWINSTSRAAYIDGGSKGTDTISITVNTPNRMELGRRGGPTAPGGYFAGHLGYCLGWDADISDAEVIALYNSGSGTGVLPSAPLKFAYDFTVAPVGGVYSDLTGNGFDLTVSGATFDSGETPPVAYTLGGSPTPQTILPDADLATTGWTTAPLFSKINDSSDATVITGTLS